MKKQYFKPEKKPDLSRKVNGKEISTVAGLMIFLGLFVSVARTQDSHVILNRDSLNSVASLTRRTGIVKASEKVMPAVVSITVLQNQTTSSPFVSPFFEDFFGELFPYEYNREIQSLGSGLIVSEDGKIITNAHVVQDANKIKVTLSDGRNLDVSIMGIDAALDLALLKINSPPRDLSVAVLGNSDDMLIGEWAIALGNPFGFLIADAKPSVTAGVVSAIGRRIQTGEGRRYSYTGVIQTDAAINPGNSGGPLANILGEVVGINSFIFTKSGGSEGIGFAIPINQVKKFIYELERHETRRMAWLGVGVQTLTTDMATALGITGTKGLIISQVFENTPASEVGLEEGWVIVFGNSINYPSEADWQLMEQGLFVGDSVTLEGITDQGKGFISTVYAVEYLSPDPVRIASLDAHVIDLDPTMRYRYNIRSREGVLLVEVARGGYASELGLRKGDVILAYGSTEIATVKHLKQALSTEESPRTLVIERDGGIYRLYRGF